MDLEEQGQGSEFVEMGSLETLLSNVEDVVSGSIRSPERCTR